MAAVNDHGAGLVSDCIRDLEAAHRARRAVARNDDFKRLSLDHAYKVQGGLMAALGGRAGACKVGIDADGIGISAPIFASGCGESGHTFTLPETGFLGIEVEIAARLSRDVTPGIASGGFGSVLDCIESFHVGVELVATRLDDREQAGALAQLADGLNAFGYVHSPPHFPRGADISDIQVEIIIDGRTLPLIPGRNAFGHILNPIVACGRVKHREVDGLKAGMLVTTGALSGLVSVRVPADIRAGIAGVELVAFQLR